MFKQAESQQRYGILLNQSSTQQYANQSQYSQKQSPFLSTQKPLTFPSLNKTLRQEYVDGGVFGGGKTFQQRT